MPNVFEFKIHGIAFAYGNSVVSLVVVLGGEPMPPKVCGDLLLMMSGLKTRRNTTHAPAVCPQPDCA